MVRPNTLKNVELSGWRGKAASIVENKSVVRFIAALILVNAVTLGLETDRDLVAQYGLAFHLFDAVVILIFAVELSLKIYAYRLSFFKVGWNFFDFIIVAISLVPHSAGLSILRALRIFRLFRLITLIPQMRNVIGALFHAMPGMASIAGILIVLLYVSAVLAVQLFGQSGDPLIQSYFGSVSKSMYTMFQLMTLENWPDIADPTMEQYPLAYLFFVPFILITTFAVLNLFIGIIVDALNIVKEADLEEEKVELADEIADLKILILDLKSEIADLKDQGIADVAEVSETIKSQKRGS